MNGPEKRSPAPAEIRSGQQEQGQDKRTQAERFGEVLGGLHHSIMRTKDLQMPVKFWENTVAQLRALCRSLTEIYKIAVVALGEAKAREEQDGT